MASFCGVLPGRQPRKNMDKKLIRAVNSFLKQTHEDKELIIVSDGCEITNKVYEENWLTEPSVKLFRSPKMATYAGGIRDIGMKMAENSDIFCFLDNDDVLGKNHLQTINDQFDFDKNDWVYYDDYLLLDPSFTKFERRNVETRYGSVGTSSISLINFHKYKDRFNGVKPLFPDGYGHDFLFMMKLASAGGKFKKLEKAPTYIVCHYGNVDL